MRTIYIIGMLLGSLFASAQTSIPEVLHQVAANNPELRANGQLIQSRKLEARLDNNLADPSVSYSHQYGNKSGMGFQGELVASQSFDFPTVYAQKHKLTKSKWAGLDREGQAYRQEILLQAKNLCLELVLLNQQKALLDERLRNAEQLAALFATRLERGDANVLETNKIDLELLNVKTEARANETARQAKLCELATLNGGEPIAFDAASYPAEELAPYTELRGEAMAADSRLTLLRSEEQTALRQVKLNRAKGLPGFELGYRLNTASGGERFNGFLVGVSIPLFSNRNNVKQARAQQLYTELQLESTTRTVENQLRQDYDEALSLRGSMEEYAKLLKQQNSLALLNKAIQAGQISMIVYFVDAAAYYESVENYHQLQFQYQTLLARLYKHRL